MQLMKLLKLINMNLSKILKKLKCSISIKYLLYLIFINILDYN